MGIESLHKAAELAGYAMAAPDDEPETVSVRTVVQPDVSRALVPVAQPRRENAGVQETVTAATSWLRGHLPAFGGRAPA